MLEGNSKVGSATVLRTEGKASALAIQYAWRARKKGIWSPGRQEAGEFNWTAGKAYAFLRDEGIAK